MGPDPLIRCRADLLLERRGHLLQVSPEHFLIIGCSRLELEWWVNCQTVPPTIGLTACKREKDGGAGAISQFEGPESRAGRTGHPAES